MVSRSRPAFRLTRTMEAFVSGLRGLSSTKIAWVLYLKLFKGFLSAGMILS